MNNRKLHVIKKAHQLFIEKGFQATSIQDILDDSGISKGTFYNYFQSKSELLIAIFKALHKELEKGRNDLLIGQNLSDIEIFIKQLELQISSNKKNKLFTLLEEVFVSNEAELKEFIKRAKLIQLRWLQHRFIDIFGVQRKPYLLDCAVMFSGILHHNFHYHFIANEPDSSISKLVRYSVDRLVKIVEDVSTSGETLLAPELLETWLPDCTNTGNDIRKQLLHSAYSLKQELNKIEVSDEDIFKYTELLEFIQEEVLHSTHPRKFLIESSFCSLKIKQPASVMKKLELFEELVSSYTEHKDSMI